VQVRVGELARLLGGELLGDATLAVSRIGPLEGATAQTIAFLSNPRYQSQLAGSAAGCVIVGPAMRDAAAARGAAIVCADPYLAFARLTQWWAAQQRGIVPGGVHPSAVVEEGALVHASAAIGPLAYVGSKARVDAGAVVGAQAHVGAGASVGAHTVLKARAMLAEGCRIGARGIVHGGAVIGADGFGFARDAAGRYQKFPQVGVVVIEDDVEIGAVAAIDRSALGETRIGRGVKIDNLVQVGHSVVIGRDTVLAGQVGIAGSSRVGSNVTLAGQVGVAGHLEIGDGAIATAQTGIPHDVAAGAFVSGYPAIENRTWLKASAVFARLPELQRRVRELERRLEELLKR